MKKEIKPIQNINDGTDEQMVTFFHKFYLNFFVFFKETMHSGARFSKNLQKLIIPDPVHILSIPIQGKGKIA
jgi:hypothetical protein